MRRQAVESSAIASMGYDLGSETLELEFRSGSVYDYLGVPPKVYRSLKSAPSKGRFIAQHIRGRYPTQRRGD